MMQQNLNCEFHKQLYQITFEGYNILIVNSIIVGIITMIIVIITDIIINTMIIIIINDLNLSWF